MKVGRALGWWGRGATMYVKVSVHSVLSSGNPGCLWAWSGYRTFICHGTRRMLGHLQPWHMLLPQQTSSRSRRTWLLAVRSCEEAAGRPMIPHCHGLTRSCPFLCPASQFPLCPFVLLCPPCLALAFEQSPGSLRPTLHLSLVVSPVYGIDHSPEELEGWDS